VPIALAVTRRSPGPIARALSPVRAASLVMLCNAQVRDRYPFVPGAFLGYILQAPSFRIPSPSVQPPSLPFSPPLSVLTHDNTVLPAAIPVILYLGKKNWIVSFIGTAMNTMGAWTRWLAVKYTSPTLAIVSSVFIGLSAAVIICSYTAITLRWFPASQRTFACSLAVQSNYLGWCIGAVIIPYLVKSPADLESCQYYQAIGLTVILGLFLVFHRDRPHYGKASKKSSTHEDEMSLTQAMKQLASNRQFVLQCFCYATLAGVSFSVPAFQV